MAVEPVVKCRDISRAHAFYTEILDFVTVQPPNPDPMSVLSKYALIERDGSLVHLSSHEGHGNFENEIYVRVEDIDLLYRKFVSNGLNTKLPDRYPSLRIPPVSQTWGMKEFSVTDPDGNKVTFGHEME